MGTSGASRGSGSNTSLVPSWLDGDAGQAPGNGDGAGPAEGQDGGNGTGTTPQVTPGAPVVAAPSPPIRPPPEPARFQSARRNFTSFARSGGSDRGALRRAVRDYVRSGTRGAANATRRMGSSRTAARKLLGVLQSFQREGTAEALRRLNLANLVGRPIEDIFLGLTDLICPDGGSVDEGTARDAWLETLAEVDWFGLQDPDMPTETEVREIFLSFVANTIETRLFQEIGINGLRVAADNGAVEAFQAQLSSYIERGVRDAFSADLSNLSALSEQEVAAVVDDTYREAWELLVAWGDQEQ